jgi:hypothetical protein
MSRLHDPGRVAYRVEDRADFGEILGAVRVAGAMTCEDLDARAGFADRYTAKLEASPEAPSKRWGLAIEPAGVRLSAMAGVWLQSLGLALLVVDANTANELGALPAPVRQPGERRPVVRNAVRSQKLAA